MATTLEAVLETLARVSKEIAVTAANLASLQTAPMGVPQDLWEHGLRSLVLHLTEPRLRRPNIITLVDYRLDADSNRLWTIDLRTKAIFIETVVSHGSGTGSRRNPIDEVQHVGNEPGSELSSVGAFVTDSGTYQSAAGSPRNHRVRRAALRIDGLDTTNNRARERAIVFHGAHYVHANHAGRSDGCFATEQAVNDRLIVLIQGGSFVYSYFE